LLGLLLAGGVQAASLLDDVLIDTDSSGAVVRILFTGPMRYQSHAPARSGRELRIILKPLSEDDFPASALFGTESRSWGAKERHPLRTLRYEGSRTTGSLLTLKFAREVNFKIRSTPDMRALVVSISAPPGGGRSAPRGPVSYSQLHPRAKTPRARPSPVVRKGFVVYLRSSGRPMDPARFPKPAGYEDKALFITEADVRGKHWYRLTLGYFPKRGQAKAVLPAAKARYPKAWVGYITRSEAQAGKIAGGVPRGKRSGRLGRALDAGRQAMIDGDYRRAIRLFSAAVESGDKQVEREALELLGLARERNRQLAQARAVYEKYLKLYPKGADAERVRQRLAGVLTANPSEREIKEAQAGGGQAPSKAAPSRPIRWDWYGTLSQEYLRDQTTSATDPAAKRVNTSRLTTLLDLTARGRNSVYDMRAQLDAEYAKDFQTQATGQNAYTLSNAYVDLQHKPLGLGVRVGRQRHNGGGILGRFDGILANYSVTDTIAFNAVAGYPVNLNEKTRINNQTHFYGLSADYQPTDSDWSFNAFYIRQDREGYLDRQAVGGEARYFTSDKSVFTLVDYDVTYSKLNILLVQGNWNLSDRDAVFATLDYRLSPSLTTSNALVGQTTAVTLKQLGLTNTESQIRQLARDRTAKVSTFTVGGSHRIREDLQVSGDITATKTGSTPASGGVAATAATNLEWLYSLQFLGNSLWFEGDSSILTLRYGDTTSSRNYTANVDYRQQLPGGWRLNPRVLIDYRDQRTQPITQFQVKPSVRVEYRATQNFEVDFEGGLSWEHQTDKVNGNSETGGYFFSAAYRWDF
jgi:tetratricopeptide (TPR) repeat protein